MDLDRRRNAMPGFGGADACADVRDVLPLRATEVWDDEWTAPVEVHLAECEACRSEAEFVKRIRVARPEPPVDLVDAVVERFEADRASEHGSARWRWRWTASSVGLSAAAAAVLALGIGLFADRETVADPVWELALEPEAPSWYGDEWLVAGGPVPEALSDEVLLMLAQEMDL